MVIVLLAFVSNWLLLRCLIPRLSQDLLDHPNARSSHSQPTPRGGGIAFVAMSTASSLFTFLVGQHSTSAALPLLAVPLAVVGFLDDRLNLPASWRFGVQLLTASCMVFCSSLVYQFNYSFFFGSLLATVALSLLLIAVTAVINFTNFMDGLDGLVAGCMAVTFAALSIVLDAPWPLWTLVGSLLGFLLWNWSPAKVFMGDVGSTFLGAVFAGLVLQATSWPEALGCLLVATPLLGDACLCVPRRLFAGQRVFQAHRLHLFQRLNQAGWPHARVALLYIAATSVLALAILIGGFPLVSGLAVAELLLGVWLDQRVAVPFEVASKS